MAQTDMTDDEILERAREIEAKRTQTMMRDAKAIHARAASLASKGSTAKFPGFTESELCYAASARCLCGAGLAYPQGCGVNRHWGCSAILKGEAAAGSRHDGALPFAFYEVKSEDEPSANGNTTRPHGGG